MRVSQIMKPRVATVEMDDSMAMVRELFLAAPFHHLLVMEGEELVGILSDKDLYKAQSRGENRRDRDTLARRVHQVMSRDLVTVAPECPLEEAASLMLARGISCLPVVNGNTLEGIVTWRDLLRAARFPD